MIKLKRSLTDQEIVDLIGDYFCEIILPICHITGYKVNTVINRKGDIDKTFSIEVNFPYRAIILYVRKGGIKMLKENNWSEIRPILFHEAFHIIHWKYKEYAESRFIDVATLKEFEEDIADRFSFIVEDLYQTKKNVQEKKRKK